MALDMIEMKKEYDSDGNAVYVGLRKKDEKDWTIIKPVNGASDFAIGIDVPGGPRAIGKWEDREKLDYK